MAIKAIVHYQNHNGYTIIEISEEEYEECYLGELSISVPTSTGKKVIPISRVYEIEFFDTIDND